MEQFVVDRPLAGVDAAPAVLWVRAACSASRTASGTAEALGWCDQPIGCVAVPTQSIGCNIWLGRRRVSEGTNRIRRRAESGSEQLGTCIGGQGKGFAGPVPTLNPTLNSSAESDQAGGATRCRATVGVGAAAVVLKATAGCEALAASKGRRSRRRRNQPGNRGPDIGRRNRPV